MSPIKGLTDRPRRLPRLGKIHLGIKVQGDKSSYPRATDYFVCPPEIQAVYGEKPKMLDIAFPVDDIDTCASVWYRCYSSYRGLTAKGDGETCTRLVDMEKAADPSTGVLPDSKEPKFWPIARKDAKKTDRVVISCIPEHCEEYGRKQCRMILNLQFLLPNVEGVGVWQIDSSSIYSIKNILDGLVLIKRLGQGRMALIPLRLSLVPKEVQPEGVQKTVHILQVTAPYKIVEFLKYAALPAGQALLPEPDTDAPEDLLPEDIQEGPSPTEEGSRPVIILGTTSAVTPAAVSGTQASAPVSTPVEADLFTVTPQEQKERLWLEALRLAKETGATTEKLQEWFKRRQCPVTLTEVKADRPPMLVTVKIITELRDNLAKYKREVTAKTSENPARLL